MWGISKHKTKVEKLKKMMNFQTNSLDFGFVCSQLEKPTERAELFLLSSKSLAQIPIVCVVMETKAKWQIQFPPSRLSLLLFLCFSKRCILWLFNLTNCSVRSRMYNDSVCNIWTLWGLQLVLKKQRTFPQKGKETEREKQDWNFCFHNWNYAVGLGKIFNFCLIFLLCHYSTICWQVQQQ